MNPRQHHLVKARLREQMHLARHSGEFARLHRAARIGNDAERAEILTAVLDLQERTRTVRHRAERDILEYARLHDVRDRADHARVLLQRRLHIVDDLRALLRPDHHAHARERTDLLRRDLRIAARNRNAGVGVRARRTADQLTRLSIAQMRHRARIDDVDLRRLLERHDLIAARAEQSLHRLRLELIHLAAERHECSPQAAPPLQIFSYCITNQRPGNKFFSQN